MLRATWDPFADDGIIYHCYAKHKIFRCLSWPNLPYPFNLPNKWKVSCTFSQSNSSFNILSPQILDGDRLRGGATSLNGTKLPMSEVFHLLSPQILDGDCMHGGTTNNGTELPISEVIPFLTHEPGGKYLFLTLMSQSSVSSITCYPPSILLMFNNLTNTTF